MTERQAIAEAFYPGDCVAQIRQFLEGYEVTHPPHLIRGGVVPHAGWVYSGRVAARVWASLAASGPLETIVLFGAVHSHHEPDGAAVWTDGAWNSPLGSVDVDEELAHALIQESRSVLKPGRGAHLAEHSLEVQIPMIRVLLPETKIVPIAVSSDRHACEVGRTVGTFLREFNRSTMVVASTDLTHYGHNYGFCPAGSGPKGEEWMRGNDERMIELMKNMECQRIVPEARTNWNACGAGAVAAAIESAKHQGAVRGSVVEYTTSYLEHPDSEHFAMAVGYVGIVFVAGQEPRRHG
jgi:AmmeMemoRadiSam system protein B